MWLYRWKPDTFPPTSKVFDDLDVGVSMNKVQKKLGMWLAAITAIAAGLFLAAAPAGVSAACSASDFTVGGVFDTQGYLACLASEATGLPATGNNTMQIVGIAIALVTIGIAFAVVSIRARRTA